MEVEKETNAAQSRGRRGINKGPTVVSEGDEELLIV